MPRASSSSRISRQQQRPAPRSNTASSNRSRDPYPSSRSRFLRFRRPRASSQRGGSSQRSSGRGGNSSSSPLQRRAAAQQSQQYTPAQYEAHRLSSTRPSEDVEDNPLDETIMALQMRKDAIGCSYYVARDERLYLMEDIQLGTLDLVEQLKLFVEPSTVILSTRELDETVKVFDPNFNSGNEEAASDPWSLPFSLDFRSPMEFDYEGAKVKLVNLQIGAFAGPRVAFAVPGDEGGYEQEGMGHQARMIRLSALVSTDGRLSVGCAGAIIAYLQRRRAAAYLPGDPAANELFRISTVSMFTLKDYMFVNTDTILSLQILQSESHPSAHNQEPTKSSSGSKEGLSVFGLFQFLARSPQGRIALKQVFLRPLVELDCINERLDAVGVFSRPESSSALDSLRNNMCNIKYVKTLLLNLRKGASGGSGQAGRIANRIWTGLQKFAFHSVQIYKTLGEVAGIECLSISQTFAARFSMQDISEVGRHITEIIDFDESIENLRTAVRQGVDTELDRRKHMYQGIEDLLAKVAEELKNDIPLGLPQDLKVVYLPQIGFLIALPKDEEAGTALFEGLDDQNWEKMFTGYDLVYYKDDKMRGMDEHFGDLYTVICDREIEIIHELAIEVLQFEESLLTASEACAELDCLLALAEGAKRYNLCRPRMTDQNVITIEGGRHLLQELTVPSFIPNDTYLASGVARSRSNISRSRTDSYFSSSPPQPGGPSMLLLTGPNFSGKSVYLKQVAIITYMAHIGCFVPAVKATIGITDKILLRIATRESVSRSQSAFMVDLQQVSMALNQATNRSLVVVDEFGKGTASSDGAGLAGGLLEHLAHLDDTKRPKVLAATHFHEIFESDIFRSNNNVAFGHMEIRLDAEALATRQHVTYLYNMRPGLSSASFGTVCAGMNGIADEIVQRAEELALLATRGEDLVVACATMSEGESRDLTDAERTAREFLARDIQGDPRGLLEDVLHVQDGDADDLDL